MCHKKTSYSNMMDPYIGPPDIRMRANETI